MLSMPRVSTSIPRLRLLCFDYYTPCFAAIKCLVALYYTCLYILNLVCEKYTQLGMILKTNNIQNLFCFNQELLQLYLYIHQVSHVVSLIDIRILIQASSYVYRINTFYIWIRISTPAIFLMFSNSVEKILPFDKHQCNVLHVYFAFIAVH